MRNHSMRWAWICLMVVGCYLLSSMSTLYASKEIKGWLERVEIIDPHLDISIRARLDTGAKSSSLHASNIEFFKHRDEEWVRFDFIWQKSSKQIERTNLEYPVKEHVLIRRHSRPPQRRPVIDMKVCIGDKIHHIDVSLIDRSRLNYPMLIGREVMKRKYLVDPDETFTAKPNCHEHEDDQI